MKNFIKEHFAAKILLLLIIFALISLILLIYKAISQANGDKYWGYIVTLLSVLVSPFVQNYFFEKQNKKNRDLADKQNKDNIIAGFTQKIYIYQYEDLQKISKELINLQKRINHINNIIINLERKLSPTIIHMNKKSDNDLEKLLARHDKYHKEILEIKQKMKEIIYESIESLNLLSLIKGIINISDIKNKSCLRIYIGYLVEENKHLKRSCESNYRLANNKISRNNLLDRNFKNIELSIKYINWSHSECVKEINNLKKNIKEEHMQ
ncbi:hypothetical protein [Apilactobacillus micheneri]|uniref:hypothetical protein n=1 Tax=Apilactobacillus micheneri TaxID=1899430 RepID=UPI00112B71A4|nr:hypothetical protein [Apilactobacillus micheneri]TPR39128.1 hypothetical protein DY119_05555 [Apilactobacillus micheneri]